MLKSLRLLIIFILLTPTVLLTAQDEVDLVIVERDHYSIAIPEGWIDLTAEDIDAQIDAVADAYPDFARRMTTLLPAIGSGDPTLPIDSYWVDPSLAAEIFVMLFPNEQGFSPAQLSTLLDSVADTQSATEEVELLDSRMVTIEAGEAAYIKIIEALPVGNGTIPFTHDQYLMIDSDFIYYVTLRSDEANYKDLTPTFNTVVNTFAIGTGAAATTDDTTVATADDNKLNTPWFSLNAPPTWLSVTDQTAIDAANSSNPAFAPFVESMQGSVQGGAQQFIAVESETLAYMMLTVTEMGVDVDVSLMEAQIVDTAKSLTDFEFLSNEQTKIGEFDAIRIDAINPVRGIPHHEERYTFSANGNLYGIILGVDETLYEEYSAIFEAMLQSLTLVSNE